MSIKIGNLDVSSFKVGSADCRVYLGDIEVYSGDTLNHLNDLQIELA